jgi:3',5'-nucleoside bisphosphate phosphatase
MIDLHTHSTFSDGSLTPEALVQKAADLRLSAIALTDHDTVSGISRFEAACSAAGIAGVAGVEISADVGKGGLHMLGYFVDPASESLARVLSEIRDGRQKRNMDILKKLNDLGLALTYGEIAAYAGEDVVGRPHFAQAMQARGYVGSKDEAFQRYLGRGKPGYADRFRLSPEDSIAAIRDAGGLAVLAHPFTLELSNSDLRDFAGRLAAAGLDGVEVYYSEHNPSQVNAYRDIAYSLGLLLTGGSDFHGAVNPSVELGTGFGNLRVNDDLLEKMRERKRKRDAC